MTYIHRQPIKGPLTWAQIQAYGGQGPVYAESGEVVFLDSRTATPQWVPSYLAGSTWTLLSSIDQASYTAGSPPAGWAEAGSVTVGGSPQYIDIAGASGGTASLTYTIPSLGAGDTVVIVVNAFGTSIAGSTGNESQVLINDDRASKAIKHILERGASSVAFFRGTGAESPQTDPIDAITQYYIVWRNSAVVDTSYAVDLEGTRRWKAEPALWGAGAGDTVGLVSSQVGGGGGSGNMYVDSCAIYQGTFV